MRVDNCVLVFTVAAMLAVGACARTEPAARPTETTDVPVLFDEPVMHSINGSLPAPWHEKKAAGLTKATGGKENPRNVLYSGNYPTNWTFCVDGRYYFGAYPGWENAVRYMNAVEVGYDAGIFPNTETYGAWTANPGYYWITNTRMAFQAFSPYSIKSENGVALTASGLQLGKEADSAVMTSTDVYYQAKTDGTQADIMYAGRIRDIESSANAPGGSYDGIQLQFRHAMSAIRFKAKTNGNFDAGTTVRLSQITVNGLSNKGIFIQRANDEGTQPRAQWVKVSGNATDRTEPYIALNDTPDHLGKKGILLGGGEGYVAPNWYGTGTREQDQKDYHNPAVNDMVIIPQEITEDMEIRVDYKVEVGTSVVQNYYETIRFSDLAFKYSDDSDAPKTFEMGKLYTINILIGMQIIHFEPVVDAWNDIFLQPEPEPIIID